MIINARGQGVWYQILHLDGPKRLEPTSTTSTILRSRPLDWVFVSMRLRLWSRPALSHTLACPTYVSPIQTRRSTVPVCHYTVAKKYASLLASAVVLGPAWLSWSRLVARALSRVLLACHYSCRPPQRQRIPGQQRYQVYYFFFLFPLLLVAQASPTTYSVFVALLS